MVMVMKNKDCTVLVEIKEKEDLYDKYNSSILNKDLSNYIYSQCHGESVNSRIIINLLVSFDLTTEDKDLISEMIKSHFSIQLSEEKIQNRINNTMYLILTILGIVLILLSEYFSGVPLLSEILSIFGWVAFWEIAYRFIFEDIKKQITLKRTKQLKKAKINFI